MPLLESHPSPAAPGRTMPFPRSAEALTNLLAVDRASRRVQVAGREVTLQGSRHDASLLTAWLYGTVHAGNEDVFAPASSLPDLDFEDAVRSRVPDVGVQVPVRVVPGEGDRAAHVEVHRVRVDASTVEVTTVSDGRPSALLPSLRPRLSPGFFMLVQDKGLDPALGPLTRFYAGHRDPVAALDQWADAVTALQGTGSSFRSKILSRRTAFPRHDALVFYAQAGDVAVHDTLVAVFGDPTGSTTEGSPLCAAVGPVLRTADEPRDQRGLPGRSFGEHRCSLIAEAVVQFLDDARSETSVGEILRGLCPPANVDADDLARNLDRSVPVGVVR